MRHPTTKSGFAHLLWVLRMRFSGKIFASLRPLVYSLIFNLIVLFVFLKTPNQPIFTYGLKTIILSNIFYLFFPLLLYIITSFAKLGLPTTRSMLLKTTFSYLRFLSIICIGLASCLFWALVPTIIDRSLSVNVLGTLYKSGSELSRDQINWSLYHNYMDGDFQAYKRISEQISIGNIYKTSSGSYALSKSGRLTAMLNSLIAEYYSLDTKSVKPRFSPPES
jgi:hypothetical protein